MEVRSAAEVNAAFAAAVNAGDLETALSLWAEDAQIIAADGTKTSGREAIRTVVASLIANGTHFEPRIDHLYETAAVALAGGELRLSGAGGDFESVSRFSVVYTRDEAGAWRIAIDAPWGLPQP